MPVEMRMWRMEGDRPRPLTTAVLPSEATLEEFLEKDPSLLGVRLLVIGRQVHTPHGKFIDLLAMDADGHVHVLELKRDKTPRDVVAQVLDYGSWVTTLSRDDIIDQANAYLSVPFETAFEGVFDDTPPDELNGALQLTIVASELDSSSERIVEYLRNFGVPINAVFFSYFDDDGRQYLSRSWLASEQEVTTKRGIAGSKRAAWNGLDWYIAFGGSEHREWEDALHYGFVSAGGGARYTGKLRRIPEGDRVNVHIPGEGYVGIGIVSGPPQRFDSAQVPHGESSVRLADQPLAGAYIHETDEAAVSDDLTEWVLPIRWLSTRPRDEAFWEKGMFANQNPACELRQEFTLRRLGEHFELSDET